MKRALITVALAVAVLFGAATPALAATVQSDRRITVLTVSTPGPRAGETTTTTVYYDIHENRYVKVCHTEAVTAPDHGSSSLNCIGEPTALDLYKPADRALFITTLRRWATQAATHQTLT